MEIDESGTYVDHGSPHDIGETIIYGNNREELIEIYIEREKT